MVALEGQAGEFGSILTDAKEPAARPLEAAQAYDNIAKAMAEADERAQEARNDAEASTKTTGVRAWRSINCCVLNTRAELPRCTGPVKSLYVVW